MEQQAPQAKAGGGTNDVTIMIVLFVMVTIGILVGFYLFLYKPKVDDIMKMHASRNSKETLLKSHIADVADLENYKDRKRILDAKWVENRKYYVLGDPDLYKPTEKQWAIFDAYSNVFTLGNQGGVNVLYLKVAETFKFYMNDEPWDIPYDFLQFDWEIIFANRAEPEDGTEISTQNTTAMVTSHTFTTVLRGTYEGIRRFIEVVQNMEGDYKSIISIHCFEVTDEPSYALYPATFGGGGSGLLLADVTIEMEMLMTFYELNESGTIGPVPDVPGTVSCSFSGGGGGGGGGGGSGRPGTGGGTMSMG